MINEGKRTSWGVEICVWLLLKTTLVGDVRLTVLLGAGARVECMADGERLLERGDVHAADE